MVSALPFDDFRRLLAGLPEGDAAAGQKVRDAFAPREFAGIADLAAWLARWSGRRPRVLRPQVAIFAGAHGIARHIVPEEMPGAARATVERLGSGGEPVNQICAANEIGLKVFDLALDVPTGDISSEAALGERDCAATMAFGMEAVAGGTDLLCLSGLGDGGPTVAAAVLAALHGGTGSDFCGAGDPATEQRQAVLVDAALVLHRAHLGDPFEVLRRLGGREIAAIAGAVLAARIENVPVILEGPAALAAAAVLQAANREALAHCRLAGPLADRAFGRAASRTGLEPLLTAPFGSAAGAGGAMAAGVLKSVAAVCAGLPGS